MIRVRRTSPWGLTEGVSRPVGSCSACPEPLLRLPGGERLRATGSAGEKTQRRTRSGLKHATDPEPPDMAGSNRGRGH